MSLIKMLFRLFSQTLSWIRAFVTGLLSLLILFLIIEAISSAPQPQIPNNSALVMTPSGILVEQSSYQPSLIDLFGASEQQEETVLNELITSLRLASTDANISALLLDLNWLEAASMTKVEELGQAIEQFKQSGKPVVAYADHFTQSRYLLASYADEIYTHPMGGVYLTGFGIYRNYFKSAADKIALRFHVFRSGQFKDAVEPYMRDNMSEQSREHLSSWLNESWQRYSGLIEEQRGLDAGRLNQLVQELDLKMEHYRGDAAQLALDSGLVDAIYSRADLNKHLEQRFGLNKDKELNAIDTYAYLHNPTLNWPEHSAKQIGLIIASGTIIDGYQHEGAIGSDSLSELIERAREDDNIVALVLRIDSGGGSAFASEVIREQLELTRQSGKKVYISMGSMAASGAYWLATAADEIWAMPGTIAGSIGVFSLIPNFSDSLNKIGIHSDGVGTSPFADAWQLDRAMSEQTKTVIQSSVDNIYEQFINIVAEARKQSPEQIDKVAQGHIWSGLKAQELGLVDSIGSLHDLLNKLKKEYQLQGAAVQLIERELSPREEFLLALMEQASAVPVALLDKELHNSIELARRLSAPLQSAMPLLKAEGRNNEVWAQCLNCIAP
ncbi:signal peptide peptidase SppA [Agaribacterium haliotis]|uniref:signal peptide peptidase SppA n=1 Tax=Agaribacterium haliotis TaxID=2013869 RepID=UPI000BB57322|nr:signal peptide peptidase SppA [Agaribacterium haliotis]